MGKNIPSNSWYPTKSWVCVRNCDWNWKRISEGLIQSGSDRGGTPTVLKMGDSVITSMGPLCLCSETSFALAADKLEAWTWDPWTSLLLSHQGPSSGVGSLWALLFISNKPVGDLVGLLYFTSPGAMPPSVVPNEQCFPSPVLVILKDAHASSFHFNSFSAKQSCSVSKCSEDLRKNDQDCMFKTHQDCSTNVLFLDLSTGCIDTLSLWKFSKLFTYVHFSGCPLYSSKNVFKNHLNQMNQIRKFGAWEYACLPNFSSNLSPGLYTKQE